MQIRSGHQDIRNLGEAMRMSNWNYNPTILVREMAFGTHFFSLLMYN